LSRSRDKEHVTNTALLWIVPSGVNKLLSKVPTGTGGTKLED